MKNYNEKPEAICKEVNEQDNKLGKYKDLTITNALKTFKKDYAKEGTNGYNRKAYIIRNYLKYPTTTNVEYNNKLNSFENENNLILYVITEGLEKQR